MPEKAKPALATVAHDSSKRAIPMEDLMLSLQKSMSRAAEITAAANTSDIDFLTGKRALYNINKLDLELNASIHPGDREGTIKVDLESPAESRSLIKLHVERQTFTPLEGPKIVISKHRGVQADQDKNRQELIIWVINEYDQPEPGYDFELLFSTGGMNAKTKLIPKLKTDVAGKLRLKLSVSGKTVEIAGDKSYRLTGFDQKLDWYVQASMDLAGDNESEIAENSSAATAKKKKADRPKMKSELVQIHYAT